ncbi:hypothetical protein, partial [Granulicatella balaenopterae]
EYSNADFVIGNGNGDKPFEVIENELKKLYPEEFDGVEEFIAELVTSTEEPITKKTKKSFKPKPKKEPFFKKHKKMVLGLISSLVIIPILIGIGFMFINTLTPPYEQLIENGKYIKAIDMYPDKKKDIENKLFELKFDGIEEYEAYFEHTQSQSALFDLSYLKQDYEKIIELKDLATNDIKKTELAVAYVKTGNPDEAYALNQQLQSKALEKLIKDKYMEQGFTQLRQLNFDEAKRINQIIQLETLAYDINLLESLTKENSEIEEQLKKTDLKEDEKKSLEQKLADNQKQIDDYTKQS